MTKLWSEKFEWFGPSPIEPFNSGIGREDFYTGTPEPTEKEAEHSAAEVASGALEPEFNEAQQRMEEKKERINIRKAMGLSAAVQL